MSDACFTKEEKTKLLDDVGKIKRAVMGEEDTGQIGLVRQMEDVNKWRRKLTLKMAAVVGAVTAGANVAARPFSEFIQHLFNL
jgi:hypothetical protein